MFNRSRALATKVSKLVTKKNQVQDFVSNPKNLKLFQQYLKIIIAYAQVLGSFVGFKVDIFLVATNPIVPCIITKSTSGNVLHTYLTVHILLEHTGRVAHCTQELLELGHERVDLDQV